MEKSKTIGKSKVTAARKPAVKKSNHGGARPGAGHPSLVKNGVHTSVTLTKTDHAFLLSQGKYTGKDSKQRRSITIGMQAIIKQARDKAAKASKPAASAKRKATVPSNSIATATSNSAAGVSLAALNAA